VVIFGISLIYAKIKGPVEATGVQDKATDLLADEDQKIDAIDGDVTK
jgi:hypothetical protein